jgi:hypothetical protein
MLTVYDTFHLVTSPDGILLVSTKSLKDPFVIVKNEKLGFFVIHAGQANYDVRFEVKNPSELDLCQMTCYWVAIAEHNHWSIAIPYKHRTLDPNALYAFTSISIQKQFSENDFPEHFEAYGSLSIITGFVE